MIKIEFLYLEDFYKVEDWGSKVRRGKKKYMVSSQSVSLYVALVFTEKTVPQACQLWNF